MIFDHSDSANVGSFNKNYESDVNDALRYTRRFFTLIGIWPRISSNTTNAERLVSKLMLPFSFASILTSLVLLASHVVLEGSKRSELIVMIGPLIFQSSCFLKHVSLFVRSGLTSVCIEHMETDWRKIENDNDRMIMKRNLKFGHEITFIASVWTYSGWLFYHAIMPLCVRSSTNEFNVTVAPRAFAGADIILDPLDGHNYEIIFCGVCVSSFFLYTVIASACNLLVIFVTHACGQIELIMSRLESLLRTDDPKGIDKAVVDGRIAIIIRYHVRVLRFASQIDKILREICFLEVISSTVIICLAEYLSMTEWNNNDSIAIATYLLLLVSVSFNVYIYCYVGELLKRQFHQIRTAAYNFEWYELPGRNGLALVMVIIVANYPPQLTAGRIIELSIHTFGTIIRTSLGYLNMLRNMAG